MFQVIIVIGWCCFKLALLALGQLCGYGLNCLEGHCVLCKYIRRRAFFILTILEKKKH